MRRRDGSGTQDLRKLLQNAEFGPTADGFWTAFLDG